MRVTFVDFNYHLASDGARLLAAILREEGHTVKMIFTSHIDHWKVQTTEEEFLKDFGDTEIYCFSFLSPNLYRALWFTDFIKKAHPDIPIIWGGVHPSAMPEDSLKHVNIVGNMESEESLPELLRRIEAGEEYYDVLGFWYKKPDGTIVKNPVWPQTTNLDALPVPLYDLDIEYIFHDGCLVPMTEELMKIYYSPYMFGVPAYTVFGSRGCPYICSYCYHSELAANYNSRKVRYRNLISVIKDDIKPMLERHSFFQAVGFMDDDFFLFKKDHLKEFCELWKKEVKVPFGALGNPATITSEKLEMLVDAGLQYLQIGIQTGSERLKKEVYDRPAPNKVLLGAIEKMDPFAKTGKFGVYGDFIIDNPYETNDDILETLKLYRQLPDWMTLNVFTLIFYPGSSIYNRALKEGRINTSYDVFSKEFSNLSQAENRRYMTYVFLLNFFKKKDIPDWVFRFLISKPVRAIGNRLPKWLVEGVYGKKIWPKIHDGLLY